MVRFKKCLQLLFIGGCLCGGLLLHGASFRSLPAAHQKYAEVYGHGAKCDDVRKRIAAAHKELVLVYYAIGKCILAYHDAYGGGGEKLLDELSTDLRCEFPELKSISSRSLKCMRKLATRYEDEVFVEEVIAQLPWSHITSIMERIKEKDVQLFYIKKAIEERWSRLALLKHIKSALHKRDDLKAEAAQGDSV